MDHSNVQFVADIPRLYDQHLGPFVFEPYARDMARRVASVRPRRVLEVACGTGILTRQLRQALGDPVELTATDLNPPMLSLARAKLDAADIRWHEADGANLPFPDGSFDAVVCQFGYMFFPNKIAAFREAARVLAADGRVFFSVWSSLDENPSGRIPHEAMTAAFETDPPMFYRVPFGYHDEALIREHLTAAGFRTIGVERLTHMSDVPSAADLAAGLVRGTPAYNAITERGKDVDAIEQDVARRLIEAGGAPTFKIRLDAKIVTAALR